ncbi:acyltransferase family protein [Aminobacter sp. HY435]|uniref:acyltransferase family protein n=1 Tax=Aminobacter sp. HY435 TaxID=2970917 RepID=UPI0022B9B2CA|nr:acyltransferase [Aminobacter sp. HY435]
MMAVALYGVIGLAAFVASMLTLYAYRFAVTGLVQPVKTRVTAEYHNTISRSALNGTRQFWNNIQLLRLLAAFAIVYVHLEPVFNAVNAGAEVVETLRFGTDLFLVVAGFLSAHVLGRSGKPAGVYLRDRAIRILPLYFIFTMLAFAAKNVASGYGSLTVRELVMSLAFIPYGPYPILHPTWTLVVIVEFSLIIAAFQLLSVRNGVYLAAAFVVLITSLGWLFPPDNPALVAYTNPILIDFALGVVVYRLVSGEKFGTSNFQAATSPALAMIVISVSAVLLRPYLWPALPRLVGLGVPATGLLFGAVLLERAGWSLTWLPANFIAKCTYSIYLCHQFVNGVSEKISTHAGASSYVPVAILVLTPVVVTTVSIGVFAFVEAPMTRYLSGRTA